MAGPWPAKPGVDQCHARWGLSAASIRLIAWTSPTSRASMVRHHLACSRPVFTGKEFAEKLRHSAAREMNVKSVLEVLPTQSAALTWRTKKTAWACPSRARTTALMTTLFRGHKRAQKSFAKIAELMGAATCATPGRTTLCQQPAHLRHAQHGHRHRKFRCVTSLAVRGTTRTCISPRPVCCHLIHLQLHPQRHCRGAAHRCAPDCRKRRPPPCCRAATPWLASSLCSPCGRQRFKAGGLTP